MNRKVLWIGGGILTYVGGVYLTSLYLNFTKHFPQQPDPNESERLGTFSKRAERYDKDIQMTELFSGISWQRKRLIKQARGKVLEIGCGTGRNIKYYDPEKVTLLVLTGLFWVFCKLI